VVIDEIHFIQMTEVNTRLDFTPIAQELKQLLKAIKGYEKELLLSLEILENIQIAILVLS
jgi:hypothetical protein